MNITIYSWRDIKHPLAGGAEQSLHEHAKYWISQGAHVSWFALSFAQAQGEETVDKINIIRRGSHFTVHLHAFRAYLKNELPYADIVIDSFHFLPYFIPLYRRNVSIVALLNEVAGPVWFQNILFPVSLIGYILEPFFFLFYKKSNFIVGSNSAQDDLKKVGIQSSCIHVINHGVTITHTFKDEKKDQKPTILFLSRLTKDKGIEDSLVAFSIIAQSNPDAQFWVGGKTESKEYEAILHLKAKELGIDQKTTFFGYVTDKEKFRLFAQSWVLVHASTKEGWGLNIIEANSQATPAVGYKVSGLIDSIQDGKTGILTEKNTPAGLAKSLEKVLSDKALRTELSENALKWSKQFSWEKAGKESWSLLKSLYNKSQ